MSEPHQGLTHLKKYDVEDSNVELIGSKLDHEVKFNSAQTEPAWKAVGKTPGLYIWRIEQFQVVPWPKDKYGQFHQGDSYVVLSSVSSGKDDVLLHDIYFWLGSETSQDEAGTAAYKTVELDEYLHGKATQHRELEDYPSDSFLSLFPRITLLHGGTHTGFTHVDRKAPQETLFLYRVAKLSSPSGQPSSKASLLVRQVAPTWQSLSEDDCYILDRGTKVWIWQGKSCSPLEKAKAAQVAHDMTLSRQAPTEVIAQTDSRSYAVLEALGGHRDSPIPSTHKPSFDSKEPPSKRPRRLFRLSDASGELQFNIVKENSKISRDDLESSDVFLLDSGLHIWVWIGAHASRSEKASWLQIAQAYVLDVEKHHGKTQSQAHLTPIAKVAEGHESLSFQAALER